MNLTVKALIINAAMALSFVSSAAGHGRQDKPEEPAAAVIHITVERQFVPNDISIVRGDTVEWVVDDPAAVHTVTDNPDAVDPPTRVQLPKGAKPFNSGSLAPGSHWKYRFTVPGVYRYVCIPHAGMSGRITVRASSWRK